MLSSKGGICTLHALKDDRFCFPCDLSKFSQLSYLVFPTAAGCHAFGNVREMPGEVDQDAVNNCPVYFTHSP